VLNMGACRDWGLMKVMIMLSKRLELEHVRRFNAQAQPRQGSGRAYAYPRARPSRSALAHNLPKEVSWLKLTVSSFKSEMRRPYSIPSTIEVTKLKASFREVTLVEECSSHAAKPDSTCKHFTQNNSSL
jgi:hypothetical protein